MSRAWRGDAAHMLPAQKIEPYRLWFEFLKLARKDPKVTVDESIYERWGPVANTDFRKWWADHWRQLFAVDIGVHLCGEDEPVTQRRDREIIVRIPLYQDKKRTLKQLEEILGLYGASDRLADMRQGQFCLSAGLDARGEPVHPATRFLKNLSKVRLMLNLYRFWLQADEYADRERLEETARRYNAWAEGWNAKVNDHKWKRALIDNPTAISDYVAFLEKRGRRKRMRRGDWNESDVENQRRQIARYLRKARHIAANVGRGEFPGHYE
jgi:hypothetical protein